MPLLPQKSPEELARIKEEKEFQAGITTLRDILAPSGLQIESNYIQIGNKYARTLFVFTYPRFLQSGWFSPIINLDTTMDIAMFIHPTDSSNILKNLKKTATRIESQIISQSQKGQVRDPMLETALQDTEALRDKLQTGTEKFFKYGLYITIYADSLKELNKKCAAIEGMLEAKLVYSKISVFQTSDGFKSTLPLCNDKLEVHNNMNSAPLSTLFPFVSSDLTSDDGILYGINRHNNSLILFDRFKMENGNMVVFAKSGAGKSYAVKLEILRTLMMGTDVIVIDPENEYKYLCDTVDGAYINISLTSKEHINPFDLPPAQKDESLSDVLRSNISNLISLIKLMLGEITPEEESIVDRGITETYAIKDITTETDFTGKEVPTMTDFANVLANMDGGESLSKRIQKYTEGSFAGFLNSPTNINVKKKMIVFSTRDMEDEMRPVAMFLILRYIWNLVRTDIRKRVLVVDEAWWMMQYEASGSFLFALAKRCRKYYLGLTTITQDVADFMASKYGHPIVTNASMQLLLKQSTAAVDALVKTFYLTDEEKYLLLESNVGEGIFFAGTKHVAIKIIASYSEDQIITTDPAQLEEIEKAKEEIAEMEEEIPERFTPPPQYAEQGIKELNREEISARENPIIKQPKNLEKAEGKMTGTPVNKEIKR